MDAATPLPIDRDWMQDLLLELLRRPSPTGRTDQIMQYLGEVLTGLDIEFELTRRGALVGNIPGRQDSPDRAVAVHSDTIGMMVKRLKPNGRLQPVPVGTHSARFAEGARVTIFTDDPDTTYTGTVLPLKASGHAYDTGVDTQGVGWDHVEVRVDEHVANEEDLRSLGIQVGDHIAFQALPEVTRTGFVKSRHLDDKAGIAAALAAVKAIGDADVELPVATHLLITIAEEVGHGASHGLHTDVAEMVSIDTAVVAPGQQSTETGVTVAMQDLHGPFDYHLVRKLVRLGRAAGIEIHRDVFTYYRSDVAAALEAGAEMRAALLGLGVDATHGHERTHLDAIVATAQLLTCYLRTDLTFAGWDEEARGPLAAFPSSDQAQARQPGIELDRGEDRSAPA